MIMPRSGYVSTACRNLRARSDHQGLLYALNEGIHGNMGGMGKGVLYRMAKSGTKRLIEDYIDEIDASLKLLAELDDSEIPAQQKMDFFYRANICFGRSALMLSGGGVLGFPAFGSGERTAGAGTAAKGDIGIQCGCHGGRGAGLPQMRKWWLFVTPPCFVMRPVRMLVSSVAC